MNRPPVAARISWWLGEQVVLAEAFLVAVSIHVVAFPLIWFVGWALPWPKPPVVTSVVEFDLSDWPRSALKPKKIYEFRDPRLNP